MWRPSSTRVPPSLLSPATARSSTAPWTTSCCAGWRTAFSTCGTWRPGRGRSPPLSRTRASSPRSSPTPSLRPPLWRRWRTCTAPISRSGAPGPPSPGRRGWNPWPGCSPLRARRWTPVRRPWTFWARTRGWRRRRTPSRGPVTSWPRRSPTTPTSAGSRRTAQRPWGPAWAPSGPACGW